MAAKKTRRRAVHTELKNVSTNIRKHINDLLGYVLTIGITLFIVYYIAQPVIVEGRSMDPNLKNGNFGFTGKMFEDEDIQRFDIVVIRLEGNKHIVKRVIGLPGENVVYKDNVLYVDGEKIEEEFIGEDINTGDFYVHVPDGQYFCLGDNREHSADSRHYGTFEAGQIIGKDIFLIIPLRGLV
ncbi:MAG: signal peptidase I [Erysipelotrichaceae bacterium]|nr:signal peptidase I [Erysipelotrichaceae bacterium]